MLLLSIKFLVLVLVVLLIIISQPSQIARPTAMGVPVRCLVGSCLPEYEEDEDQDREEDYDSDRDQDYEGLIMPAVRAFARHASPRGSGFLARRRVIQCRAGKPDTDAM